MKGLDQRLVEFFPELLNSAPKAKRNITLRDLLLMRSGLQSTSFEHYGAWVTSDNWLKYALTRPLVDPPGKVTNYSTGNSHIVAAILSEATGQDLRNYAQKRLFDPIEVRIQAWQKSPEGYRFGGNNFALTVRGFLRFGRLYLQDGKWKERQVIPAQWVRDSTRRYVYDTYHGFPYGYYWWNATFRGIDINFAWGHGGQFLFFIPKLRMVVVTTGDPQATGETNGYNESVFQLMKERIIPSVHPDQKNDSWFFE